MIDFPTLLNWLFQTAVAFVSTIAFAIIFTRPGGSAFFAASPAG